MVGSDTPFGWSRLSRYSARSNRPGLPTVLAEGLEKVNGEWSLICTGHNLLKLFRSGAGLSSEARVNRSVQGISDFAEIVNTVPLAKRPGAEWLQPTPIVVAA